MNWNSPYQTAAFQKTLQDIGFDCREIHTGEGQCYASNWMAPQLTAWELATPPDLSAYLDITAHAFSDITTTPSGEGVYYTPVIRLQSDYKKQFTGSCCRNIKKAVSSGCYAQQVTMEDNPGRIEYYTGLFFEQEENRSFLSPEIFRSFVVQAVSNKCADVFVVHTPAYKNLCMAVVLTSATIANLRFTAYNKALQEHRPMNYLVDHLCHHYSASGFELLDLSGYTAATEDDRTGNINRFKRSFTSTIAEFKLCR